MKLEKKKNAIILYFSKSKEPLTSLIFTIPLLLFYNIGVLLKPSAMNGADFLTKNLLSLLSFKWYILLNLLILILLFILIPYLKKKKMLHTKYFIPVFLESFIYAISMGNIILGIMKKAHLFGPSENLSTIEGFIVSAGAGFHEEFFFRFLLMGGFILFFKKLMRNSKIFPYFIAILLSSILFSLAHYIVEDFEFFSFIYRTLGGMFFAFLFILRGFSVAVYTHFLYDVIVIVF